MPEIQKNTLTLPTYGNGMYLYDFGNSLPYGDPKVAELLTDITNRHINNTKMFGRMGFALQKAIAPDGGSADFAVLQIPDFAPRELVSTIFNELNASGYVNVQLRSEKYPTTNSANIIQGGIRRDVSNI